MKRVAISGCGGTGKSPLARRLGKITGLPVYNLDSLYRKPGWIPTPEGEWDIVMTQLVSKKEWIIDGNYSRTMDIRLNRADTIIFLDYPTHISIFRVLKRRIQYHSKTRPDMANDCTEKLDLQFLKWIWNFRKRKRPELLKKLAGCRNEKQVYVFTKPRQLKHFLKQLSQT